jgi:hypothetical protein
MISSPKRIGIGALFADVLLSSAMPASATLSQPCYPMVSGLGRDPIAAVAFEKAKTNWRINVENAYGSHFANWSNAENRGRHYYAKGGLYYFRAYAQPCSGSDLPGGVNKNPVTGD